MKRPLPYPSQAVTVLFGERLREGHGTIEAPGAPEPVHTVGSGYYERLLSLHYVMDTNAGLGARYNGFQYLDPDGRVIYEAYATGGAQANSQPILSAGYKCNWSEPSNVDDTLGVPSPWFWLWPGCQIKMHTIGLTGTESYDLHWITIERTNRDHVLKHYLRNRLPMPRRALP